MSASWAEVLVLVSQFIAWMLAVQYVAHLWKRTHPLADYLRRLDKHGTWVDGIDGNGMPTLYYVNPETNEVVDTRSKWERDRDDALADLNKEFNA